MLDRKFYDSISDLSPFEIKDELIKLARTSSQKAAKAFLNAGRGNPNWTATRAREAFFLLGQFALTEAKRAYYDPKAGVAGMPPQDGAHARFQKWTKKLLQDTGDWDEEDEGIPPAKTLSDAVNYAIKTFGFDPDGFVHELTDSIIGDNYPVPDRALHHNEIITHEYLMWAMCAGHRPKVKFDLYPVEGGTAAMCYIFKALKNARILNAGDTIALGTPIFTPYLEMPQLEDYTLKTINVSAEQEDRFQFTDDDIKALENPQVKALFLVNPGNPSAVAMDPDSIKRLVDLVNNKRPDLIILTDDVYGTFVPGFQSLLGHLPRNTIGVYSYSKYFGCTGWRLGVIAVAEDNIFDEKIKAHPEPIQKLLEKRYKAMTPKPRDVKFIDRIVADSRDVALNHTAGLSLPQQVMMSLFSLVELMDVEKLYQKACIAICTKRFWNLVEGMGVESNPGVYFDHYYGIIDFEFWLRKYVGQDVVTWVKDNIHPLDIPFRLAEDHGIVLLNGSGFDAPSWSARVSFANLNDDAYSQIGRAVRSVARGYVQTYQAAKGLKIS
ncbi:MULTISPECIES: bifunctional aspartate transaminase/aspartate 4-decarboxylase [unclassified Ensifer]|uniref:bifunctional aspartate transaminase/aspartate 4-decarboxylase n=1 Tax=unclassified Ensifer TaxID=2633371 RepID=UPI00081324BB|nr:MULTISPECIES: bifunctional aspartate transaminase/aspartate 4-decarboxylase [unclassified Ensifer]OCO98946.1 aspartate 4-decarboxylase [Ensifer sp. LC14]OCP11434.1 aspartate 4-decarboxylase [Ensifer sp. LC13]OCP12045.1 aspartate 4-decarboxylase [Ensifer sp. LC11]OCP33433.1 aspartate 4-decarboxylase [Ensifer sp. LC499]